MEENSTNKSNRERAYRFTSDKVRSKSETFYSLLRIGMIPEILQFNHYNILGPETEKGILKSDAGSFCYF